MSQSSSSQLNNTPIAKYGEYDQVPGSVVNFIIEKLEASKKQNQKLNETVNDLKFQLADSRCCQAQMKIEKLDLE